MIRYYLKAGLRSIFMNRFYSVLNIAGLAVGIAAFFLIIFYVKFERSYDHNTIGDGKVYRLRYERSSAEGESVRFASCCPPAAIRIRELYPEAETVARIFRYRATVIFGDKKFYEERMFFAEPDLFRIFSIPLIAGDAATGIVQAGTAFISESYARKYFGDDDPLGKTINVDREMSFVVTGIFRDFPANSHLKADILLSWPDLITHYGPDIEMSWGDTGFYTYLILNPSVSPGDFEKKLAELVENDFGEVLRHYRITLDLRLQPLEDIHLNSAYMQELEVNGDADTVRLLTVIAIFILIIAWANYINITTARSLTRATETGISKVAGAGRGELIAQFYTETMLVNIIAFVFAFGIIAAVLPAFRSLTGIPYSFSLPGQEWFIYTFLLLLTASIIISGTYPAFVLTSYSASEVLRGRFIHSGAGLTTRKVLVTFQLAIAICLVTCSLAVFGQIHYLRTRDKGIDISDVLVVRAPRVRDSSFGSHLAAFREELTREHIVTSVSVGTEVPGRQILWDAGGIFRVGSDQSKNYQIIGIDYDYLDLLGAEIVAGRNFDRSFSDSSSLILNEKATRWMEFNSPGEAVGAKVNYWGDIYTIAGVVRDYRQQSPREDYEPHIFRFMPYGRDVRGYFLMKYIPGMEERLIEEAGALYSRFFPDNPFDYFFLEDYYEAQYDSDRLLGVIFAIFAVLAMIVTALGIIGLTSFMMLRKAREISIRRVHGADISGIVILFSREFLYVSVVSFLIASIISAVWIRIWLSTFEARMSFPFIYYVIPFLIIVVFVIATVTAVIIKTAGENPVVNLAGE